VDVLREQRGAAARLSHGVPRERVWSLSTAGGALGSLGASEAPLETASDSGQICPKGDRRTGI